MYKGLIIQPFIFINMKKLITHYLEHLGKNLNFIIFFSTILLLLLTGIKFYNPEVIGLIVEKIDPKEIFSNSSYTYISTHFFYIYTQIISRLSR